MRFLFSYLFDIELSLAYPAYASPVTHASLLINGFRVRILFVNAIFTSLKCAEVTSILFDLRGEHFIAAEARTSDRYDLLYLILGTASLLVCFNLRVFNSEDRIILSEIELSITNLDVLFTVLLEFVLVDVGHDFEAV